MPVRLRTHCLTLLLLCLATSLPAQKVATPPAISAEVQSFLEKGDTARAKHQWQDALDFYRQALEKAVAGNDTQGKAATFMRTGGTYAANREYLKALDQYQKGLPLYQAIGDKPNEASSLTSIGGIYYFLGKPEKALEHFEQALPLLQMLGDRAEEVHTLSNILALYTATGRPQKGIEHYQKALLLSRELGNKAREADALMNLAEAYHSIGQSKAALEQLERELIFRREIGDRAGESNTLTNIASIYSNMDQPLRALDPLEKALLLNRELRNRAKEAEMLSNLGLVYTNSYQPQKALEQFEKALPILREVGDKRGEAATLIYIGGVYANRGQPQQALGHLQKALLLHHEVRDTAGEAKALSTIGAIYSNMGQPQEALGCLQKALLLHHALGNRAGEAETLMSIGAVSSNRGQPQQALVQFNKALILNRELGNRAGEADALSNIGGVYANMGQPEKALEQLEKALPIRQEVADKRGEAITLSGIGVIYSTGQPRKAIEPLLKALVLNREIGNRAGEADTLTHIGVLYSIFDQPKKALEHHLKALRIRREVGDQSGEAITLNHIGLIYFNRGQSQQALEQFQNALRIARKVSYREVETKALLDIGRVYQKQGQPAAAKSYYRQAVDLMEQHRAGIGMLTEAKVGYLQGNLCFYHFYLNLLLQKKAAAVETAFNLSQKTKARSLVDLMEGNKVDLSQQLPQKERAEEQQKRTDVRRLHNALLTASIAGQSHNQDQTKVMQDALTKAEQDLQRVEDQIALTHPGMQAKRAGSTYSLQEIGKILPADTALLEYVTLYVTTGDKKIKIDRTVLFVVTVSQGKAFVQAMPLAGTAEQWRERKSDFVNACSDPTAGYEEKAAALASQLLPAKARALLAGKKRLIVCPDGPLWGLPFQALRTPGGKFWLQQYEIAYAYSATGAEAALKAKQSKDRAVPSHTLLAFANPDFGGENRFEGKTPLPVLAITDPAARPLVAESKRPLITESKRPLIAESTRSPVTERGRIAPLPGTQMEADALRKDFPGSPPDVTILKGKDAQKEKALQEMTKYRYLHFATHGWFSDTSPMQSCIVLAEPSNESKQQGEEGFLTARDIFDLNLSADLVVLSACDTARGKNESGEGMMGLTWALFAAGAPTQVVSQWSVSDDSTAALMQSFYANLIQSKMPKGAALRQAALSLQKDGQHSHPYYWAPFILMGDWR